MKSKNKFDHKLVKKIKEELPEHDFGSMEEDWSKMRKKLALETRAGYDISHLNKPLEKRKIFFMSGIAASLLLIAGLSIVIAIHKHKSQPLNTFSTENEIVYKKLPDSSRVWINRYSEIRYPGAFNERIVYLKGEAFFEVKADAGRPFRVITPSAVIKVVGTSFNIKAYPEAYREIIAVNSGVVGVCRKSDSNSTFLTLRAGETLIIIKQDSLIEKKEADDPNYMAWKSNIFEFKDTPLLDVARILEEAYGYKVVIQTPELDSVGLNAYFNNTELGIVLNTIALTLDLEILERNDSILISKAK